MSFCVVMAGVPGSSKSPTASFLSVKLNLSVFSHDQIRIEIRQDTLKNDVDVPTYLHRRDERLGELLNSGVSFIYDASADRSWPQKQALLKQHGYDWFLISFNLSSDFLAKLAKATLYEIDAWQVEKWYQDHQQFWSRHAADVDLVIDDKNFAERLHLALDGVQAKFK